MRLLYSMPLSALARLGSADRWSWQMRAHANGWEWDEMSASWRKWRLE